MINMRLLSEAVKKVNAAFAASDITSKVLLDAYVKELENAVVSDADALLMADLLAKTNRNARIRNIQILRMATKLGLKEAKVMMDAADTNNGIWRHSLLTWADHLVPASGSDGREEKE